MTQRRDSLKGSLSGFRKIPLLRQLLADPQVNLCRRAIDNQWRYERLTLGAVTGFNPFQRTLYSAERSALTTWLNGGMKNDRDFNDGDFLCNEVLFLIHDYLHVWAYMVIQDQMPDLEFGHGPITPESIERFVFCHLVTEAVATVGLDYWFLSTIDLAKFCGNGTALDTLTVSYSEDDCDEYRHFNPTFTIQNPHALVQMAEFYCTGYFHGFSGRDLRRSAKLRKWMSHELAYGQRQRQYIREWLSYLSNGRVYLPALDLGKPVAVGQAWQRKLMRSLAEQLWAKVKSDQMSSVFTNLPPVSSAWRAAPRGRIDFRFTNLNRTSPKIYSDQSRWADGNFEFVFSQFVSGYEFESFPNDLLALLPVLRQKQSLQQVQALFAHSGARRVAGSARAEPIDLFFPN